MINESIAQKAEQLKIEYHWENVPQELKTLKQWVLWKYEPGKDKKLTKVPYRVDGVTANKMKSEDWNTFEIITKVLESQKDKYNGIGLCLSKTDRLVAVDIDHCIENGIVSDEALKIIHALCTYTEISPSGTGVHMFIWGTKPEGPTRKKNLPYEIYAGNAYLTITGNLMKDTPPFISDSQEDLEAAYRMMFPPEQGKPKQGKYEPNQRLCTPLNLSDQEIISLAENAVNSSKFIKLYHNGDLSEYSGDHSAADLALCNILSFYTGRDFDQIDRIFRSSALNREKWEERPEYRQWTIDEAISKTSKVYQGRKDSGKREALRVIVDNTALKEESEEEPEPKTFNLTDLGNAERLVYYSEDGLRYCHPWHKWLVWDGKRWGIDEDGAVNRIARDTVRKTYAEASKLCSESERKELAKHAMSSESSKKIKAMIEMATSLEGIPVNPNDLDVDPWFLNCNNGTIDLKTGELLEHNQTRLITKLVPINYDPEAKAPRWLEFLGRIMKNDESVIRFLQRAVGYSLTGSTREQVMFILHGSGANGKSTFIETITAMLGEDFSRKTPTKTLMVQKGESISNDVARLKAARFVSAVEAEEGQRLAESFIKQITGGDTLTARFMRAEYFEFKPEFKLFFATNHKPQIRGTDRAIWRRLRLIPFDVTIPETEWDLDLPEKLRDELPGILAWAVEGCKMWQKEGLGFPEAIKKATEEYRAEQDVLGEFLEEVCEVRPDSSVANTALYMNYKKYCEETGEEPIKQKSFTMKLKERGFVQKRGTGGIKVWHGITLN